MLAAPKTAYKFPHPRDPAYPDVRNEIVRALTPRLIDYWGFTLWDYQKDFLFPPPPYDREKLTYAQLGGAKRIGKSMMLMVAAAPYLFMPGAKIRFYAPEYENAEREISWLDELLFSGPKPLCDAVPWLSNNLIDKQVDPRTGVMQLVWNMGNGLTTSVVCRSWERRNAWVGEAIDLAVLCEPGLFPDIRVFTKYVRPNLADRSGKCIAAGTVDNPWMKDIHDMAHDHAKHPDLYCRCEVARRENLWPGVWSQEEEDRANPAKGGSETVRDFAINWLGHWDNYADVAFEKWAPQDVVKRVSATAWSAAKRIPPGWEHYLVVDTGRNISVQQWIYNGTKALVIDEFTNYTYRAGQITPTDTRGFVPFFSDIMRSILAFRHDMPKPIVVIDPSSHFKREVENFSLGVIDAVNAHDVGVHRTNQALHRQRVMVIRPQGRAPYALEYEIPKVKWAPGPTGQSVRHMLNKKSGADHSADGFRYGCATILAGEIEEYEPERIPGVVEKDIDWLENRAMDSEGDTWGDITRGGPGDI